MQKTRLYDEKVLLQRRVDSLEEQVKELEIHRDAGAVVRQLCRAAAVHANNVPKWALREPTGDKYIHGIPTLFVSDIHYGETVFKAEVGGANEFDVKIANKRIETTFTHALYLVDSVLSPSDYEGLFLVLGGDMVSGNIHEEIRETNGVAIFDAVLQCADQLEAGIKFLLQRFPKIVVPCVVGNHGRLDKKPRMKRGPADNYEYILYHILAGKFRGDERVTFIIPESYTCRFKIYNTRFLLTHGDQFKGGSGIAGPATPWALGDHKLRKQMAAIEAYTGIPSEYDVLLFGHFHQLKFLGNMICNGSLKGFDEYAKKNNFPFEPPMQALWMTHPRYGVTLPMAVFGEER